VRTVPASAVPGRALIGYAVPGSTSAVTDAGVIWDAGAAPPRFRAVPAPSRWRITMRYFEPIAAISLEEINILWTADLAGTEIDPTGGTAGQPQLPVQFAVPVSSGNFLAPAQPQTWYTATWLTGDNIRGYVAQGLAGPGGAVTLAAGTSYDVWSKITGSPESPVKFAGVQAVY
jgi:hypothetical protein